MTRALFLIDANFGEDPAKIDDLLPKREPPLISTVLWININSLLVFHPILHTFTLLLLFLYFPSCKFPREPILYFDVFRIRSILLYLLFSCSFLLLVAKGGR